VVPKIEHSAYTRIMQLAEAIGTRVKTPTSGGRRIRLDEIGITLTWEEALNLPVFIFLAMNGMLHISGLHTVHVVNGIFAAFFWILSTLAFLRNRSRIHWEFWTCRFAFIFLLFTLASVTWGTAPLSTVWIPCITAICTFLYFNYLLDRYSLNDVTRMMVWAFGILLSLSLVAVLGFPSFAIDNGSLDPTNFGCWKGVLNQKNILGIATALGFAVALGLRPKSSVDRAWRWLLILEALLCAYGTVSREAQIAMAACLAFSVLMLVIRNLEPRSRMPILLTGLCAFAICTVLIYLNLDAILALIGKTRDLNGRANIWSDTFLLIRRRPWLGYGIYGVWQTPYASDVVVREGWNVSSSHNNYVEVLLGFGAIGLCFYLPIILSAFLFMARALFNYNLLELQVLIYVMITLLILSMASPLIVYSPSVGMVLLLYCVSHLERIERTGFMTLRTSRAAS